VLYVFSTTSQVLPFCMAWSKYCLLELEFALYIKKITNFSKKLNMLLIYVAWLLTHFRKFGVVWLLCPHVKFTTWIIWEKRRDAYAFIFVTLYLTPGQSNIWIDIGRWISGKIVFNLKPTFSTQFNSKTKVYVFVSSHQYYKNKAEIWVENSCFGTKMMENNKYGELTPTLPSFLTFTNFYSSMVSGPKINMESCSITIESVYIVLQFEKMSLITYLLHKVQFWDKSPCFQLQWIGS
jgi:hypothetical protein